MFAQARSRLRQASPASIFLKTHASSKGSMNASNAKKIDPNAYFPRIKEALQLYFPGLILQRQAVPLAGRTSEGRASEYSFSQYAIEDRKGCLRFSSQIPAKCTCVARVVASTSRKETVDFLNSEVEVMLQANRSAAALNKQFSITIHDAFNPSITSVHYFAVLFF